MNGLGLWAVRKDALEQSAQSTLAMRSEKTPSLALRRGDSSLSDTIETFSHRQGSTAIIPVLGPLMSRVSWMFWSYDEIVRDVQMALDDETIDRILLDVDSPGGMVAGCDDCMEFIRQAGTIKPVVAHTGGLMASAAFWIASAASTIAASRSANIGSVGALIRYVDIEGIFVKLGGRVIEVVAEQSPMKSLDPESEDGRNELQAIVDGAADLFIEGLSDNRGETREFILERFGQGLVFKADEALSRSMIDRLEGFDTFLSEFAGREDIAIQGPVSAAVPAQKDYTAMEYKTLTVSALREHRPDLIAEMEVTTAAMVTAAERDRDGAIAARDDAAEAAEKGGVATERDRVTAILKAVSGTRLGDLAAKLISDGTDVSEATRQILDGVKADAKKPDLEEMEAAAAGQPAQPASPTGEHSAKPAAVSPTDAEGLKAEWGNSESLKREFLEAEDYVAFKKGDSEGRFKILKGREAA